MYTNQMSKLSLSSQLGMLSSCTDSSVIYNKFFVASSVEELLEDFLVQNLSDSIKVADFYQL